MVTKYIGALLFIRLSPTITKEFPVGDKAYAVLLILENDIVQALILLVGSFAIHN